VRSARPVREFVQERGVIAFGRCLRVGVEEPGRAWHLDTIKVDAVAGHTVAVVDASFGGFDECLEPTINLHIRELFGLGWRPFINLGRVEDPGRAGD
jgi:hypothetical protein